MFLIIAVFVLLICSNLFNKLTGHLHDDVFLLLRPHSNLVVVCHLHGQTGRSTVWANGRQNSGLENFLPISSITEKKPRTPETGIKDGFGEMEHDFQFEIFRPEKQDYLFRFSVAPGNFPSERLEKPCSFTFQPDFPENFL